MDILYATILFLHIYFYGPSGTVQTNPGEVASAKVKAAHKYHGILLSLQDETGEYFNRDGKRCKLFTQSFITYIKGKQNEKKFGHN